MEVYLSIKGMRIQVISIQIVTIQLRVGRIRISGFVVNVKAQLYIQAAAQKFVLILLNQY